MSVREFICVYYTVIPFTLIKYTFRLVNQSLENIIILLTVVVARLLTLLIENVKCQRNRMHRVQRVSHAAQSACMKRVHFVCWLYVYTRYTYCISIIALIVAGRPALYSSAIITC